MEWGNIQTEIILNEMVSVHSATMTGIVKYTPNKRP
jgi:hypothetical protein